MPSMLKHQTATFACCWVIGCCVSTAHAETTPSRSSTTLPKVEVVSTTPLSDVGIEHDRIAAAVQTATAADLEQLHAADLTELLSRKLGSVHINDVQNNPLQPDINFRGYTASPLLGTPQGIAVYMDGVRLNQPFGDVVSWDSVPRAAIQSVTLLPGSNPLFGLNALGGALAIRTKDGFSDAGTNVKLSFAEHSRRIGELEYGDHTDTTHWYFTGNSYRDDGWRDYSPSSSDQLFGKFGWVVSHTQATLSASYAKSNLRGNGMQEQRLIAQDYASVYTTPDITENSSTLLNLTLTHALNAQLKVSGNLYYRDLDTDSLNGDINEGSLDQAVYQPNATERAALTAAGFTGFPLAGESAANTAFPYWRCIANALLNEEPNEKCNGLLNTAHSDQQAIGATTQITLTHALAAHANQFTIGVAFDKSRVNYRQGTQFGYLNSQRGIVGVFGPGAIADGTQNSEDAFDARVELTGRTQTLSAYATDTFTVTDTDQQSLHITLSGRFNRTHIENEDGLTPEDQPGSLFGEHTFSRFNPAIGVTSTFAKRVNTYLSFSESSRAPSTIELGCADPENPCKLPNALAADPALKQVVARTWEAGIRSVGESAWQWSAGVFRSDNRDDIMFVADDQSGFGYFTNFGATRRQGLELGTSIAIGKFTFTSNYTYLQATYESDEVVNGTGNSTNDLALAGNPGFEGTIDVEAGDRIPLIPEHTFKLAIDYALTKALGINVDMIAVSGTFARGNENNEHEPDGVFYLGDGKTPGYAVVNLGLDYRVADALLAFIQINNVFDHRYYTASQLGATGLRSDGSFIARPFATPVIDGERPLVHATFYSPGAPRLLSVGLKYRFGL